MKQLLLLSSVVFLQNFCIAQVTPNDVMAERVQVKLNGTPHLKVVSKKTVTSEATGKTYTDGATKFVESEEKTDYSAGKDYVPSADAVYTADKILIGDNSSILCDVKQDGDQLIIYPWPFKLNGSHVKEKQAFNNSLGDRIFYLDVPTRMNLRLPYKAWFIGAVTLPLKIYVTKPNKLIVDNAIFDANLNFAIGKKFGSKHYVTLPHEKEGRTYENLWSVSFLTGITKIDLTETNITDEANIATFKPRSVAGISVGVGAGYHYKDFSLFLAAGVDNPIGSYADVYWAFTRQLWLGFGIGFQAKG